MARSLIAPVCSRRLPGVCAKLYSGAEQSGCATCENSRYRDSSGAVELSPGVPRPGQCRVSYKPFSLPKVRRIKLILARRRIYILGRQSLSSAVASCLASTPRRGPLRPLSPPSGARSAKLAVDKCGSSPSSRTRSIRTSTCTITHVSAGRPKNFSFVAGLTRSIESQ
jgi:hypothetical protein